MGRPGWATARDFTERAFGKVPTPVWMGEKGPREVKSGSFTIVKKGEFPMD
jgi:hypothetical protein